MALDTNAQAVALTGMRKQRQRERHARSHEKAETPRVEDEASVDPSQASEPLDQAVHETDVAPETELREEGGRASQDLDALSREIERTLSGGGSTEQTHPVPAQAKAAAPPSRNARPEDILGLHAPAYEQIEEPAARDSEDASTARGASEEPGPPPMEDFEERAAMAKEVLRATSDQTRRSRRQRKPETAGEESPAQTEDVPDETVRFSEDLTISARKRQRRKLFGR